MTRKSLNGQLNLFDFFGQEPTGHRDVEMVAISPQRKPLSLKEKEKNERKTKTVRSSKEESKTNAKAGTSGRKNEINSPVMSKVYQEKTTKQSIYIAYLDYYKVYIQEGDMSPYAYQFHDSKSAVDFYVQFINELEDNVNYRDLEQSVEVKEYVIKELK